MIGTTVLVLPESVTEDTLTIWCKQGGEYVKRNDAVAELETDKITLKVPAPHDSVLNNIIVSKGSMVTSTQLLARLKPQTVMRKAVAPVTETLAMPSARLEIQRSGVELANVAGSGGNGRILRGDVRRVIPAPVIQPERVTETTPTKSLIPGTRQERREPMSRLRQRITGCLLVSQRGNTIPTTFSEVNMQSAMDLRARWKDYLAEKHDAKLGFMSSLIEAVTRALRRFPVVDASVNGDEIIWHDYCGIDIAVSSNRDLVALVLYNAQSLSLVEIEQQIAEYAAQVRSSKLPLRALQDGTFSITNGGTFDSVMPTPIVNPPQSTILETHAITPRPVVGSGQVVVRPMMHFALSYDHCIIDDQETVQTLVVIHELLELPEQLSLDLQGGRR